MKIWTELVDGGVELEAAAFTSGSLTNSGVDVKHEVGIAARIEPSGPIQNFRLADKLVKGQTVKFSFKEGQGKVTDYGFHWRDDAGKIRYSTEWRSAPNGRFFSSVGGWWMTDPDADKAQSFLPFWKLA